MPQFLWRKRKLLTGCASAPPATQNVEVPVDVPCVKDVLVRPAFEFDKFPATASDGDEVLALARDWPRGRVYELKVAAVISGCN
jgi:hypothetical protein